MAQPQTGGSSVKSIQELHARAVSLLAEYESGTVAKTAPPLLALVGQGGTPLSAEIGAARDAVVALRDEVAEERREHEELLERLTAERDRQIAGLKADRDAVAEEATAQRQISDELRVKVADLSAELQTLVDELDLERADREDAINALLGEIDDAHRIAGARLDELAALAHDHETARLTHQNDLLTLADEAESARAEHARALAAAGGRLREAFDERDGLRAQLVEARTQAEEHAARAERAVQGLEARSAELVREIGRLTEVGDRAAREAAQARAGHAAREAELTATIEAERVQAAATLAETEASARQEIATARSATDVVAQQLRAAEATGAETARRLETTATELAGTQALLAARNLDIQRLEVERRSYQEALVTAQRELATAHVGIASSQHALDQERVQRGALDARLHLERTERAGLESRMLQIEAAGAAAVLAERDLRHEVQADLRGKLADLRDELAAATARIKDELADERATLQRRIAELEACVEQEREGRLNAEGHLDAAREDRDEVQGALARLSERIDRAGAAAQESAERCAALERELAERDAMLQRVGTVAAELRQALDEARSQLPSAPEPTTPAPGTSMPTLEALTERIERLKQQARAAAEAPAQSPTAAD